MLKDGKRRKRNGVLLSCLAIPIAYLQRNKFTSVKKVKGSK